MINYAAFRAWTEMQKRTNNTVVALSIGTHLAERELARPHPIGTRAGDVLAGVTRAERLDVSAVKAEEVVRSAAADLAFLAIPQIVALHIELMVGTLEECQAFPGLVTPHKNGMPVDKWYVPDLAKATRFRGTATVADRLMEFCVTLRNCIMHGAGRVDDKLVKKWVNLPASAKTRWENVAGRPFTYTRVNLRPALGWGEIQATLAVTKESAGEINQRMVQALSREQWADVIARDYRTLSPRRFHSTSLEKPGREGVDGIDRARPARVLLRLQSHASTYYQPLGMTLDELHAGRERIL
ncbi:hypothetical protein [Streptomyces sp. NBC_01483]|uniref:hypothetical protein n=1 Tax=Streptomyces sp. NBC_01483 TaxID=2903883 RepID=UPI002E3121B4|nr:hypothetical protein [Streptomyces sp. NBC_01483]